MGRKIFISYKFSDGSVQTLDYNVFTTVRSYVDKIESFCDKTDHIYKAESNNDDLSHLTDDQIWEQLKDRIFDSSVTIVMISPHMKNNNKTDKSQWIPWEISYSLKEMSRNDRVSRSNAMLAVVLPDENGSYEYFIIEKNCSRMLSTTSLFNILSANMFNEKNPNKNYCETCRGTHYVGESSYIESVKWEDFKQIPNHYIEKAVKRQEDINKYNITKSI